MKFISPLKSVRTGSNCSHSQFFRHTPFQYRCRFPPTLVRILDFLSSLRYLFSRVLLDSTPCFVGPSVGPSVRRAVRHFTFSGFLRFLASLLLPKWSGDLNYGPCPPARDWGSRGSGLKGVLGKNNNAKNARKYHHNLFWQTTHQRT